MEKKQPKETKQEALPDVEAFNDEYTRDFLLSGEEVMEGFYRFQSKTGKYEMAFPADGIIVEQAYRIKDSKSEEVSIGLHDERGFGMDIFFFSYYTPEDREGILRRFKSRLGYDGEFEEIEKLDKTIYFVPMEDDELKTYGAYIENKQNSGGLEVVYNIKCDNEDEQICEDYKEEDKAKALKWMDSFTFINDKGVESDE